MRVNIFEGSRRILLMLQILWAVNAVRRNPCAIGVIAVLHRMLAQYAIAIAPYALYCLGNSQQQIGLVRRAVSRQQTANQRTILQTIGHKKFPHGKIRAGIRFTAPF